MSVVQSNGKRRPWHSTPKFWLASHWPLYCTNWGIETACVVEPLVTLTTVSSPPITYDAFLSCPVPRKSDSLPCMMLDKKNVRFATFGIGPPTLASNRLKPTLMASPNGESVSVETEPR